jgi:hypothetical protein
MKLFRDENPIGLFHSATVLAYLKLNFPPFGLVDYERGKAPDMLIPGIIDIHKKHVFLPFVRRTMEVQGWPVPIKGFGDPVLL